MKIAIFHNLPPGGAKRILYEELKILTNRHELHLFEYSSTDEKFMDISAFCKNVTRYPFEINSNSNRLVRDYNSLVKARGISKAIAKEIDLQDFDVCFVHPDKYTQSPFVLRYLNTPKVYFCEELLRAVYEGILKFKANVGLFKRLYENSTRVIKKEIDRNNAQSADAIFVASDYIGKKVKEAYGKIAQVCPFGVDSDVFKNRGERKLSQVLFIGDPEDVTTGFGLAEKCVELINEEIRPNIKVISFSKGKPKLTDSDLAKQYSSSIVALCTSYNEPFGLIPLESMACETPVLAVNGGGYKETILHRKTGYLLERNENKFAEKIEYLIRNPRARRRIGEAGRKHVKMNYNWAKHCNMIEAHLEDVANEKS